MATQTRTLHTLTATLTVALAAAITLIAFTSCGSMELATVADTQYLLTSRSLPLTSLLVVCDTREALVMSRARMTRVSRRLGSQSLAGFPAPARLSQVRGDLADFGRKLQILAGTAEQAGVKAQYYLAKGTPDAVIKLAQKWLGKENVFFSEIKQ